MKKEKELLKIRFIHCGACRNNTISGHVFRVTETKGSKTTQYIEVKDKKRYKFIRRTFYSPRNILLVGLPCKWCGHLIPEGHA